MAQDVDPMWRQYASALLAKVPGVSFDPGTEIFSVASTMLFQDVANTDTAVANASIFPIADTIPAWTGSYGAQGSVFTSYTLFLNEAILGLPSGAPRAAAIRSAGALPETSGAPPVQGAGASGAPPVQGAGATGAPARAAAIARLAATLGSLPRMKAAVANSALITLTQAANLCLSSGSTTELCDYNMKIRYVSAGVSTYAPQDQMPTLMEAYRRWQENAGAGEKALAIELSSSSAPDGGALGAYGVTAEPFVRRSMSGNAGAGDSGAGDGSGAWDIRMAFTGCDAIPIQPGPWFAPDLITAYGNRLPSGAPAFFGAGGSMSLLPVQAIFAYQPTVFVRSGQTTMAVETLARAPRLGPGLLVGPFPMQQARGAAPRMASAGGAAGGWSVAYDSGPTPIPVLLGVICRKL